MTELTTVRARERVFTYGLPVTIGVKNTKGAATERKDAKGNKIKVQTRKQCRRGTKQPMSRCEGQTKLRPETWCRRGGR